ncbi:MAG TPA: LamG-like jellyroll fold domain-containing protein, partial [Bacillota bacterium]|nr:LamG-like jellyroll fold domain-containing protein [Bacillota bacterium]
MKVGLKQLFLSTLLGLAGLVPASYGQIQVAGNLQVNVDAVGLPVGPVTYLTNSGAAGGVFLATNNNVAGITPQVFALGGNGTRGVLVDGSQVYLKHYTAVAGGSPQNVPDSLAGATPVFSVEAWVCKATAPNDNTVVSWGNRSTRNCVACNYGANIAYGAFSWNGADYGWAVVPPMGSWHHLAWTYSNGSMVLYRDGVVDKTITGITGLNVYTNNILLGAEHAGTGYGVISTELIGRVRVHDGLL